MMNEGKADMNSRLGALHGKLVWTVVLEFLPEAILFAAAGIAAVVFFG